MKLNISIEYRTKWGEEIVLCLGGRRYPLSYVAEGVWQGEIARFNPEKATEYGYEVVRDGVAVRTEWKRHSFVLTEGQSLRS
jgi:4-alpha-glucanotransferase